MTKKRWGVDRFVVIGVTGGAVMSALAFPTYEDALEYAEGLVPKFDLDDDDIFIWDVIDDQVLENLMEREREKMG